MQFVRTLIWVVILVALLVFSFFNWRPVEVTIWENLVLETRVPALVIISFLLGLLPMWLLHRGASWRLNRRIASLEAAAESQRRVTATPPHDADAAVTTTGEPVETAPSEASRPQSPNDPGPLSSERS